MVNGRPRGGAAGEGGSFCGVRIHAPGLLVLSCFVATRPLPLPHPGPRSPPVLGSRGPALGSRPRRKTQTCRRSSRPNSHKAAPRDQRHRLPRLLCRRASRRVAPSRPTFVVISSAVCRYRSPSLDVRMTVPFRRTTALILPSLNREAATSSAGCHSRRGRPSAASVSRGCRASGPSSRRSPGRRIPTSACPRTAPCSRQRAAPRPPNSLKSGRRQNTRIALRSCTFVGSRMSTTSGGMPCLRMKAIASFAPFRKLIPTRVGFAMVPESCSKSGKPGGRVLPVRPAEAPPVRLMVMASSVPVSASSVAPAP